MSKVPVPDQPNAAEISDHWQARIDRLMDLDRRLRLIEAYVAVIEERVDQLQRGEAPRRHLRLVPGPVVIDARHSPSLKGCDP